MNAQQALYEIFNARLKNASALWGVRVEPLSEASSRLGLPADSNGKRQPYVVFYELNGKRDMVNPHRKNAQVVMAVKAVACEMAQAMAASDAISALLDDSGRQDVGSAATNAHLPTHADWDITTVTEENDIWMEEKFSGAESIYHAGHQYRVMMEKK